MARFMAVRESMEIAAPADSDTLGSYGQQTCQMAGCSSPARYRGRCFKHWRESMAEEPAAPPKDAMTDDQQRELIAKCRTRKQACLALGMSPKSLGALDKRCLRLGIKPKWMRLGDVQSQPPEPPAGASRVSAVSRRPRELRLGAAPAPVGPDLLTEDRRTRMARWVRNVLGMLLDIPDADERAEVLLAVSIVCSPAPKEEPAP